MSRQLEKYRLAYVALRPTYPDYAKLHSAYIALCNSVHAKSKPYYGDIGGGALMIVGNLIEEVAEKIDFPSARRSGFKAILSLKCIGDPTPKCPYPWVAEIYGIDEDGFYQREFLDALTDYSNATRSGKLGICKRFVLSPGPLYEVFEHVTLGEGRRYFCQVVDGHIQEIPEEAVQKWLSTR